MTHPSTQRAYRHHIGPHSLRHAPYTFDANSHSCDDFTPNSHSPHSEQHTPVQCDYTDPSATPKAPNTT